MKRLWREFWPEQPYEVHLKGKIEAEPDLTIVAEADGQIVGTVIGGWDGWWAWVYRLTVAKEYQNCGIGTELVRRVQVRLGSRGARGVAAVVSPDNGPVCHVLEGLGYTEDRHRIMGRPLKSNRPELSTDAQATYSR